MAKRRYSDEEKANALAALASNGGNVQRTAIALGIPAKTLENWSKGTVHPSVANLGEGKKVELADLLEETARKLVADLLEMASTSQKDCATALGIVIDKRQILLGKPTSVVKSDETVTARTDRYTAALEEMADQQDEGGATGDGAGEPLDSPDGPGQADP